jgi:hypothetical protein
MVLLRGVADVLKGAGIIFTDANRPATTGQQMAKGELRWGDAKSSLGGAKSSLGDANILLGDAKSSLGDAKSSLGDAKSSLGDAKSSLGDAESSLGDAESSLGDARWLMPCVWLHQSHSIRHAESSSGGHHTVVTLLPVGGKGIVLCGSDTEGSCFKPIRAEGGGRARHLCDNRPAAARWICLEGRQSDWLPARHSTTPSPPTSCASSCIHLRSP